MPPKKRKAFGHCQAEAKKRKPQRANETPKERERRLANLRKRFSVSHASETEQQREARLKAKRERATTSRASDHLFIKISLLRHKDGASLECPQTIHTLHIWRNAKLPFPEKGTSYTSCKISDEAVCYMGAVIAYDRPKTYADRNFPQQCLSLISFNPWNIWCHFVTVVESWIHHYTAQYKQQLKKWTGPGERASKKAKTVVSAGKDSQEIILIGYLKMEKKSIFATLLDRLKKELCAKCPSLARKRCFFTTIMLRLIDFQLAPHPSFSIDLAPCDFFLFSYLNKWLEGRTSNEELIDDVNGYFEDL
ncbi:hypothetical protein LAZ67_3003144 [Cordylochernes scorpioides]|uniref:STPR domain-containing protein n=1 Tax=Cordylochernes scorpioides TaxID=51811 RepID=A0ABY6K9B9_9ARAC|nr:hypothetical protein LAZ67_3003144 [Cordylochernes scorpioides]